MSDTRTELDIALSQARNAFTLYSPTLSRAEATLNATWVGHTWAVDGNQELVFPTTPRVAILSDKPESGKTTVMEMAMAMSRNGHVFGARTATPAGMINAIREQHCTLAMDEIHRLISRTGNGFQRLLEIMQTGYREDGQILNALGFQKTFAPLMLAGIGRNFMGNPNMAELRSRCLIYFMTPLPDDWDEDDEYDPDIHKKGLEAIGEKLGAAVMAQMEDILAAPARVPGLRKRARQLWSPLYRIAIAAGGTWPEDVLQAAREVTLKTGTTKQVVSPEDQLFNDIREAVTYITDKTSNLSTMAIIDAMTRLEVPSIQLWTSSGQAARAINQAMAENGLPPKDVWFHGAAAQGYRRQELNELFGLEDLTSQDSSLAFSPPGSEAE